MQKITLLVKYAALVIGKGGGVIMKVKQLRSRVSG